MQQIDKQDTQTTYGQEHDDPKHNVIECAVSPAFNAAPPQSVLPILLHSILKYDANRFKREITLYFQ